MAFPLLDETTAPEEARDVLKGTKEAYGVIPNMERVMAAAPPLLKAYELVSELYAQSTLSPIEREVVLQTSNFENECDYCVPWHTLLAKQAGMARDDVEAMRQGAPLSDAKLEALRQFARRLIHTRGNASQSDVEAFLEAGFTDAQAMEVVLGLALKVMSNYTNSIAGTPLDDEVKKLAWTKPVIKPRV